MAADNTYQTKNYEQEGGDTWFVGGTLEVAGTLTLDAAAVVNDGPVTSQRVKVVKLALTAGVDTGGGVLSWANPEAGAIFVQRLIIDITTPATAACLLDAGTTPTSGTTLSDNLIDGIDVHTAVITGDNLLSAGTNGKQIQNLAAGKWLTISTQVAGGASAGLVGNAYIEYVLA